MSAHPFTGAHRVVAVVRHDDAAAARGLATALLDGGLRAVEITLTTPGALELIAALARDADASILVGSGTARSPDDVRAAVAAGARFVVSPGHAPELAQAARQEGVPYVPGLLTPSEALARWQDGHPLAKLYPAHLGGIGYLRELRGLFPELPLMATGGVTLASLESWFDAGAAAAGVGSELRAAFDRAGSRGVRAQLAGFERHFAPGPERTKETALQ